jgi:mono/diheme cytochrome c family protein
VKEPRFATFSIFACFLLFASSTLFAQTEAGANLLANPVFKQNCAKCHGKTAEGRHFGGPSLVSDNVSARPDDDLRTIIINGKGRMPKYAGKLKPEEISTLVEQIKALNRNKK